MSEPVRLDAEEVARGAPAWHVLLHDDALELRKVESDYTTRIPRAELPKKGELLDGLWLRDIAVLELKNAKRVNFKLAPADFKTLKSWWGPPTWRDLLRALRPRMNLDLGIGLLFVVNSLPLGADAENAARPFSPMYCALGVWLILVWVASRLRPDRTLWLLDVPVFLFTAGLFVWEAVEDQEVAPWKALVVVICLWLVGSGVNKHRRYAGVVPDPAEPHSTGQIP